MKRRDFHRTLAAGVLGAALGGLPVRADERDEKLARHRIAAIDFRKVNLEWPRRVGRNAVLDVHGNGPRPEVCILRTDQGAEGWGLIRGNRQTVLDLAKGVDGQTLASLFSPSLGVRDASLLPLDFALHDLAGQILELPVWKMVATESRDEPFLAPIYSGMIYFDDLDPPEAPAGIEKLIEECQWDYDYGYRQFKLKIGRGHKWMQPAAEGLKRDIEAVQTIAAKFPDCEVLVDANNGYTLETCIEFLKGVAGTKLFWIEEPFHETVDDYRRLHEWMRQNDRTDTYLADGEARPDTPVLEQLQRERVLDIRLEDIVGHGFTPWRRLLADLAQQNVLASPHTWGTGVKTVYVAHLAGGLGHMPTIEGVTCTHEDVDFGENVIEGGKQQVSSAPGFGLTLRKK